MVELSAERGYEGVTVRSLTRLAGVSTRSFYKHFANAEECFAHTYDWLVQDALRRAYAARNGGAGITGAWTPRPPSGPPSGRSRRTSCEIRKRAGWC